MGADKDVSPPTLYTHHTNATKALTQLKAGVGHTRLSPNLTFDNSPARDAKMYEISDLSNLNQRKEIRKFNNIDAFLELENILPHQNTLARGFQKGSHYDYIVAGQFDRLKGSNFHMSKLSDNKVAKMLGTTMSRLENDEYIGSGPTQFDSLKKRSQSIFNQDAKKQLLLVNSPSGANNYESGAQISPLYSSLADGVQNPDYMSAQHSN